MKLDSEPVKDPYRLPEVNLTLFLGDGVLISDAKAAALQELARNCPVANTLAAAPPLNVRIVDGE